MSNYDLAHCAGLVVAKRARFAEIHDPLAARHGGTALKLLPYFYLPPAPGAPAFLVAFERADAEGWVDELLSALLSGEAMADPVEPVAQHFEPQQITRPDLGFQDVGLHSAGSEKAKRRVCLLTVGRNGSKKSYGSGFLVGPQMILTSWHVIERLLDPDDSSKAAPDSREQIAIQFDHCTGASAQLLGVHQDWLVSSSPSHDAERGLGANAFSTVMAPDGFESCLDYALIRLSAPVGRERGYYRLDQRRKPEIKSSVMVYQHPNGDPLQSALGASVSLWPEGVETRLRHNANTAGGASGGLVLDAMFEPVALHQAGITLAGNGVINSAIPTACIAISCIAKPGVAFESVLGVDPIWRLERCGRPVFARIGFQELILEVVIGKTRIVIVRGEASSGKSFTTKILRDRLGQAEHSVVELSSRLAPTGAREMAIDILEKAGVGASDRATLPLPGDADTAPDAWVRDVLVRAFMALLKTHAGARQIWIVIDHLDTSPLPQTACQVFIEHLLSSVGDNDFLRFILIGGARYAKVCPLLYLQYDDTQPAHVSDVQATISRRASALGHMLADDPRTQAMAIVKLAKDGPGRYMDQLVEAYRQIVETA